MSEIEIPNAVILDRPYSNALIGLAYTEQFAYIPEEDVRDVLSPGINPSVRQKALQTLLIFEKVIIDAIEFDSVDEERLYKEGLVETSAYGEVFYEKDFDLDYAMSLKGLILADFKRTTPKINLGQKEFDELIKKVGDDEFIPLEDKVVKKWHIRPTNEELLEHGPRSEFDELYYKVKNLRVSYNSVGGMIDFAKHCGLPIKSNLASPKVKIPECASAVEETKNVFQAYEVYLRDIGLPLLTTISDVLRLRDRKHQQIEDFRLKLFEWAMALGDGNANEVKKISEEIEKAARSIGKAERRCDYAAYISLSIGTGSLLGGPITGIVGSAVGGAISLGAKIDKELKKRKYSWLLFGRER